MISGRVKTSKSVKIYKRTSPSSKSKRLANDKGKKFETLLDSSSNNEEPRIPLNDNPCRTWRMRKESIDRPFRYILFLLFL